MEDLKLMENSIFYISSDSKDIHYQYIKREIFDLLVYDMPFCPLPSRGMILDIGANIGMFAQYAISRKNNSIICFEPALNCLPALYKNLEPYTDKVYIIEKGVWNKSGSVNFYEHNEFSGCNRIVDDDSTREIEVISIDELNLKKVDFIKMDIEGAELEALVGASNTIKTFKPRMAISVYHKPNDEQDIIEYIKTVTDYKVSVVNHTYIGIKIVYFYL